MAEVFNFCCFEVIEIKYHDLILN